MSKLIKSEKRLATSDQPYVKKGEELWALPFNKEATGVKHGDILAEVDGGFLYVYNKEAVYPTVSYMPLSRVQI